MRKIVLSLAVAAILGVGAPALAQTKGPNGGLISGEKGHAVELIPGATEITVYLLDDGKVEAPKGATVRAVIQDGSKNESVTLTVDGNKLVGKLSAPLNKGARVVISGKDGAGHTVQGRFVIP